MSRPKLKIARVFWLNYEEYEQSGFGLTATFFYGDMPNYKVERNKMSFSLFFIMEMKY